MSTGKNAIKGRKLNLQERKFVQEYVLGEKRGSAVAAAAKSYNANGYDSAHSMAVQVMRRPRVLEAIEKLLKKHGLTDDLIFEKIEEGLNATIPGSYKGRVFESDVPDFNARHKYLQDTLKIGNYYPPERKETRTLNLDLQVEKMQPEEVKALLSGMMKKVNAKG